MMANLIIGDLRDNLTAQEIKIVQLRSDLATMKEQIHSINMSLEMEMSDAVKYESDIIEYETRMKEYDEQLEVKKKAFADIFQEGNETSVSSKTVDTKATGLQAQYDSLCEIYHKYTDDLKKNFMEHSYPETTCPGSAKALKDLMTHAKSFRHGRNQTGSD